jgi:hypothetical protein
MNFGISWVLGLFKKPEIEITFDKAEIKPVEPFPVEKPKRKPRAKKPAVAAKTVAKKKAKAKK